MILFAGLVIVSAFTNYPVPFDGAIILLGSSISGYTGVKSLGVTLTARELPVGVGVEKKTKDKLKNILIGLYVIIAECLIVQAVKTELVLPLDNLFIMAGICSGVILAGHQAMTHGEKKDG